MVIAWPRKSSLPFDSSSFLPRRRAAVVDNFLSPRSFPASANSLLQHLRSLSSSSQPPGTTTSSAYTLRVLSAIGLIFRISRRRSANFCCVLTRLLQSSYCLTDVFFIRQEQTPS